LEHRLDQSRSNSELRAVSRRKTGRNDLLLETTLGATVDRSIYLPPPESLPRAAATRPRKSDPSPEPAPIFLAPRAPPLPAQSPPPDRIRHSSTARRRAAQNTARDRRDPCTSSETRRQ